MNNTDLSSLILGFLEDNRWRDDVDADWLEENIRKAIRGASATAPVAAVSIDPADIVNIPQGSGRGFRATPAELHPPNG